jgi:undecaprenyl-phosphate 4-deoxy-4-formamido-L-arabinose transferase
MNEKHIYCSAVIPVFNEERNIDLLYDRLSGTLKKLETPYEIIFVDDGSADSSYEELKKIALSDKAVKVIGLKNNFGQHKAVIAGLLEARGDYILTMDADLQNPPEEGIRLLEKAKEGFDMVSGYRKTRKDSFKRRFFSFFINIIISAITGLRMKDYGSMLRVFRRKTARELAERFAETEGYITMLVAKVTRNVAEMEVSHDERYSGESKYNLKKLFSAFFRILCYHNDVLHRLFGRKRKGPLFVVGRKVENGEEKIAIP